MDFPLRPDAITGDEARSFSIQQERASDASEIELRPLVPSTASTMQHDGVPDRTADLRSDTDTAASPGEIDEPAPQGGPSLHSPRLGLRSKDPSVLKKLVFDSWIGEAVVVALSMGCLAAIAIIVSLYDGEPLPQWRGGVTLNTVISVLSTTARSGMIFVVSATMGQLKWCWFGRSRRRLLDMQAMDDASRGPMGAARVLVSLTGGTTAALGAVTTVLMVAFSPFLQQLLAYPVHDVEQKHIFALAPRNLNYTSFFANGNPSLDLFNLVETGLWSIPKPLEPNCPTAYCEWDTFKSVGWCSKCTDRTNSVVLSDCNIVEYFQNTSSPIATCSLSLGTGSNTPLAKAPFNETDYRIVVRVAVDAILQSSSGTSDHSMRFETSSSGHRLIEDIDQDYSVLGFGHVKLSLSPSLEEDEDWSTSEPVDIVHVEKASRCILTLCERDVAIQTEEGSVHSTLSSPNYGNLFGYNETYCWQPENRTATLVSVSGAEEPDGPKTFMDRNTRSFCPVDGYSSIADYVTTNASFDVYRYVDKDNMGFFRGHDNLFTGQGQQNPFRGQNPPSINIVGDKSTRSFEKRLENVATALTNYGLETTNETVRGRAYAEESYVEVRWQWIVLPVLLQLSTLVLFITTVAYSHCNSVPIWKSSILAIIYHGVEDLDEKKDLVAERLSGMNAVARVDKVQFSRNADGIHRLYGRSHG
jgi:hypothetical protein